VATSIDTNIVSALWSNQFSQANLPQALGAAKERGALLISAVVYAELLAHPKATESFVHTFLADTGIVVDFEIGKDVWLDAARRFARYASQRRKSGPGEAKRLLADFVIGSHALLRADRLMTLDPNRYRRHFPELKLV
jgi:predicted nucleic acid-binding protein